MINFYKIMLWLTEFELQIARSTGRCRLSIVQLTHELHEYELSLFKLENTL